MPPSCNRLLSLHPGCPPLPRHGQTHPPTPGEHEDDKHREDASEDSNPMSYVLLRPVILVAMKIKNSFMKYFLRKELLCGCPPTLAACAAARGRRRI